MTPLRFGIVGTGRMAARMMGAFAHVPGAKVVAVASAAPERAQAFARAFHLSAHTTDGLLAEPGLDAVYLATRNADHAMIAVRALRAGKAVLCEKPAAASPEEALFVVDTARASRKLFMEAISTPFLPAFARAVALARDGSLGRPTHLRADFGSPTSPMHHPGIYREVGGGVLLDRLVYPLVLALAVFGPVARVQASVVVDASGLDVEASVLLDHEEGGRSELSVSLLALSDNSATIACPGGRIVLSAPLTGPEKVVVARARAMQTVWTVGRLRRVKDRLRESGLVRRLAVGRAGKSERHSFGRDNYTPEVAHFCALLRSGRCESDVVPFDTTLAVQRIIAEVRAAAHAAGPRGRAPAELRLLQTHGGKVTPLTWPGSRAERAP